MDAIDRLADRLDHLSESGMPRDPWQVARFIYSEYLPSQIIGMKKAAHLVGVASSNTLSMRLDRGHDLLILAKTDADRITTVDACDAYLESHGKPGSISDDVRREAS
jgi:hypothetical protein